MACNSKLYKKRIVAKYFPKNGCFVENGVPLIVRPLAETKANSEKGHYFLSSKDQKSRSKYGWIEEILPFTLLDFVREIRGDTRMEDSTVQALQQMLEKIESIEPGKPVAVGYFMRGLPPKPELAVHRVIFHPPNLNSQ